MYAELADTIKPRIIKSAGDFQKSSRKLQISHNIHATRKFLTSSRLVLRARLTWNVYARIFSINSPTGGAHAMKTTTKDLAESRPSAPPLSSSRR
jgi:hypothetical protein